VVEGLSGHSARVGAAQDKVTAGMVNRHDVAGAGMGPHAPAGCGLTR